MKLLVIDTATEACSVALQTDQDIIHRFEIFPQQHSQRLLPMIDEVLKQAGLTLNQLDYLGFGQGPGSFTGVRIATGMLQGLALGTGLPVVGVSTLAAMAQQVISKVGAERVATATDARMSEVYFACYENHNGLAVVQGEEQVLDPTLAVDLLPADSFACAGTGWQAYAPLQQRCSIEVEVLYPNALYMLPLARQAIAMGQARDVMEIKPVYLRDKVTWKKLPGRE